MALTKVKIDFCICFSILDLYFDAKIRKNFYTCISGQVLKVDIADVTAVLTIMAHQSSGSSSAGTGDGGSDDGGDDDGGDKIYDVAEVPAEFPGGNAAMMQWLKDNMRYPQVALEEGIQGRVIVRFVVEKDGSRSNIEIMSSADPCLNNEAIRLIQTMPKWTPAYQNGQPVRYRFTVPIMFRLNS